MIEAVGTSSVQTLPKQPQKAGKIAQAVGARDSLHSIKVETLSESPKVRFSASDEKTTFLQILDYIPLVGNFKNLLDFVLKIVWRPSDPSKLSPQASKYFEHISEKGWYRCLFGVIPVLGNLMGAVMDSNRRNHMRYLVPSVEEGHNFEKLYHGGSPRQKELAIEASFTASLHRLDGNAGGGQKALLQVLQKGEPAHQKKVLSWLMNNIQNWRWYPRHEWYKKENIPAELKDKLLELFVQNDLQSDDILGQSMMLYREMSGSEQNKVIAAFCKAADAGNPRGFKHIKDCVRNAQGPEQKKMIFEWLCKQAENPSSPYHASASTYILYELYSRFIVRDPFVNDMVFDWCLKQAENPSPAIHLQAWMNLRYVMENISVEKFKIVFDLCKKMGTSGNKALRDEAILYLNHQYYVGEQKDLAFACYLAIADKGDIEVMKTVAYEFQKKQKKVDAIHWYTRAANAGDIDSMYRLTLILDKKEGRVWLEKAANLGHIHSILDLGMMFQIDGDLDKALHWYQKAAALGDSTAKIRIAEIANIKAERESQRKFAESQRAREEEHRRFKEEQRAREEEYRRFKEERFRNAESNWEEERANAQRSHGQRDIAYFQDQIEKILGGKIANDITVKDFKSLIRKWMVTNHPDKVKADEREAAEARIKLMHHLVDQFKEAKKRMGAREWDYK